MGWIRAAGLGFAALLSAGAPLFAQEDTVVRWHDVRALLSVGIEDPEGVDLRLHLSSSYLDSLEPDRYDVRRERSPRFDTEDWADVLRQALGEDGDGERFEIDSYPGMLRVAGGAEVQGQVAGILGELKGQLLRSVELEVFVLPASAIPASASSVLGEEEAAALLAKAEPLDYSRKTTRLGQRLRLGGEGGTAVLMDYDVEVATKGRAADPQITVLREGLSVGAIAKARPGGGFFLRVWGRRGSLTSPPRRFPLEHFAGAPLELPSMSNTLVVSSAAIADGGGILVGQDWNEDGVWLVRARYSDPAPAANDRRSPFLPLGELAARPLVVASPWLPTTEPSGGWGRPDDSVTRQLGDEAREQVLEPEEFADLLRDQRDELELGGNIQVLEGSLYVKGSPALLELAALRVKKWSEALAQDTVEVEVRLGLMKPEAARQLVTELEPKEIAGALKHRLLGACRLGDTLLVLGGVEHYYLKDHDVEIAQAAVIQDPIIGNRFEGVSFWCRLTRASEHTLSGWVDLAVQTAAREPTDIPTPTWEPRDAEQEDDDPSPTGTFELTSSVELPATARAGLRSMVQLVEGEWMLLCCTGLAGTEESLVAVVRAR